MADRKSHFSAETTEEILNQLAAIQVELDKIKQEVAKLKQGK